MTMRTLAKLRGRRGALVALSALLAGGCVVSPQPSPPAEPSLDGSLIGAPDIGLLVTEVVFEAAAGAVDPPMGVVVVTNLDTTDPPVLAEVLPDGSFSVSLGGQRSDAFRFQAKQDGRRSQPVDRTFNEFGAVVPVPVGLPCFEVEPEAWIAFDGSGDAHDIVVRNGCDVAVTVAPPRLRRGVGPANANRTFLVDAIPPGGSSVIPMQADGGGEEREDVVFLDITAPEAARRALTITLPD